ncbi:hypothetical protein NEOLEDRAFT_1097724 [Neolentinus lepideus HHB14362 ss-1]|uniref:Uncharacterized protein n=1 Tax=Neolentinus lepideus HHB14362 ss-1 TaxID=1314782 RepID=A0A165QJX1_9AGAM|nr:hypothetical protein NEOLEDRAFT_1097724 [Neolentinus lepideus HHB14362 ss-1]
MIPLPPHFTSLYRLCLRATSASVLHQSFATKTLRTLVKPSFREAAKIIRQLQDAQAKAINDHDAAIKAKEKWLEEWNERADNTLSLLLNSATSRGLANNLTRNLVRLQAHYRVWAERRYYTSRGQWDPSLPPNDRRYQDPSFAAQFNLVKSGNKRENILRQQDITDAAWGALGEVVKMAEGRDRVSLGRVNYHRRRA